MWLICIVHPSIASQHSTTKCKVLFLRCLCWNISLNIPTCFDPQGIITREPNQIRNTDSFTPCQLCVKVAYLVFVVLLWFGSLVMIYSASKHVGIYSVIIWISKEHCSAFCWLSVAKWIIYFDLAWNMLIFINYYSGTSCNWVKKFLVKQYAGCV
jgi:hypothetical protein